MMMMMMMTLMMMVMMMIIMIIFTWGIMPISEMCGFSTAGGSLGFTIVWFIFIWHQESMKIWCFYKAGGFLAFTFICSSTESSRSPSPSWSSSLFPSWSSWSRSSPQTPGMRAFHQSWHQQRQTFRQCHSPAQSWWLTMIFVFVRIESDNILLTYSVHDVPNNQNGKCLLLYSSFIKNLDSKSWRSSRTSTVWIQC